MFGPPAGGRLTRVLDIVQRLGGPPARPQPAPAFLIVDATDDRRRRAAYGAVRRRAFVDDQHLFAGDDTDAHDDDPRTRVLAAVDPGGVVLGGVRIHPEQGGGEIGWWRGSRLVCGHDGGGPPRGRIGAALVRAACAVALDVGALRFDAHVQERQVSFFARLGWEPVRRLECRGEPHRLMRWPVGRFEALAEATKQPLGGLLGALLPQDRWRGDDGVPVPGSDVLACVDAITPSMVERDPEWAGWCGILVTAHDLAAMGAEPIGALDALGAADSAHAERIITGLRAGAEVFDLPILGGHTQLGVPAALSVTGLGRSAAPVPAGGGRPGDDLTLSADLAGGWRPGYRGRQWDSTSWRTRDELGPMLAAVREARPHAAKDVSMAGIVGTAGMLGEASGCGVDLDVAAIPRPREAELADWLTCFPGFAVLTADVPTAPAPRAGAAVTSRCGRLTGDPGVRLHWPDGDVTTALSNGAVTGLGSALDEKRTRWPT
ncbi:MAG TPA: MSMEG_0567/sll0787 family protein [Solirubrobacteraceae bacterium]